MEMTLCDVPTCSLVGMHQGFRRNYGLLCQFKTAVLNPPRDPWIDIRGPLNLDGEKITNLFSLT